MHFYAGEIGHGQHLREQPANVLEMCENAFGAFVRFATQNLVAADSESVEKILFLSRRGEAEMGLRLNI